MPRDFVKRFQRRGARSRALTGRGPSPQELEAVTRGEIGAQLDVSLREQVTAEQIRASQERSELERESLKQAGKAATFQGVLGVGELGLAASKSETVRGLAGKVAETRVGEAVTGAASRVAEKLGISAAEKGASELAAEELAGLGVEEAAVAAAPSALASTVVPGAVGGQIGKAIGGTKLFQEISPFGGEKTEGLFGAAIGGFVASGFNPLGALVGLASGLFSDLF